MGHYLRKLLCYPCDWAVNLINYFNSEKQFNPDSIRKILILKNGMIGDVLMTTPLVRSLKRDFPSSKIVYSIGKYSQEAISNNYYVDKVIELISPLDKSRSLRKRINFIRDLRRENFDMVFVLDLDLATILLAYLTKTPIRVGFDSEKRGFLLTHKVIRKEETRHEIERYLDLLRLLNLRINGKNMDIMVSSKDELFAKTLLKKESISNKRLIVGISPGGARNSGDKTMIRRWTSEGYAQLADKLASRYNAKVLIFGGKSDKTAAKEVSNLMKFKAVDLTGKTSIKEAAALIKKCSLFITHDCGLMHIAAAVGTPTIAIFGPTNPGDVKPYGKNYISIKKKISCSPCLIRIKNYYPSCKTHLCMEGITSNEVFEKTEALLRRKEDFING